MDLESRNTNSQSKKLKKKTNLEVGDLISRAMKNIIKYSKVIDMLFIYNT